MKTIELSILDVTIIVSYLVLVAVIGYQTAKRTHDADDLFLAGRRLTWLPIGFSLFASNISSSTLIGLMGAAYTWGIAVSNYEWMAAPILVFAVFFIIPVYIQNRISTVPEYLEYRYSSEVRRYFSMLTIIANIVIDTAGTLYAGAIVFTLFLPELSLTAAAILIALLSGIYTAAGGLAAVVYTDILQAVILIFGSAVIAVLSFAQINYSWAELIQSVPEQHLSLLLPIDNLHLPWLGTLVGIPILGFYFWCTNQFIVQRILAARSLNDARWGALFAGLLKLNILFLMVLPGVMAIHIVPGLQNGDLVFPALIEKLLPSGLMGIVIAALVAALMSSIDSTLNSAATLVTLDFIKPNYTSLSEQQTMWIGRVFILVFMMIAAIIAPLIGQFEGLFAYLQTILSYWVPPVVVIFLFGIFGTRTESKAALITLIVGHMSAIFLFIASFYGIIKIHFTLVAGLLFLFCCLILGLSNLFYKVAEESPDKQTLYCANLSNVSIVTKWWRDYRLQSLLLLGLTIWEVVAFL
jgi:SSS family solute:Na+ symporter